MECRETETKIRTNLPCPAKPGVLPAYLLGFALGALGRAGSDYRLRSGCTLVPAAPGRFAAVSAGGARRAIALEACSLERELRDAARAWAEMTEVALGGAPVVHAVDADAAKAMAARAKRRAR